MKKSILFLLALSTISVAFGQARSVVPLAIQPASQAEVDAGVVDNKYVSPATAKGFLTNDSSVSYTNYVGIYGNGVGITNVAGLSASVSNAFDLAGTALAATNGLGSAAFVATSAFDASGAALAATNGLGSAAFSATSAFDVSGAAASATNIADLSAMGLITNNQTGVTLGGTFSGDGAGLTNTMHLGDNVLVVDNVDGNDTLAAASPYKYPWKTALDLNATNPSSWRGAIAAAKAGDWIYIKPSSNVYYLPKLHLQFTSPGLNLRIPGGVTVIYTNRYCLTNGTLTPSTGNGGLIIPGTNSIVWIDGEAWNTNTTDGALGWNLTATNPVNYGATGVLLKGRGYLYGFYDTIIGGAGNELTIEDMHLRGDYDCINMPSSVLVTRNIDALCGISLPGALGGISHGIIAHNKWTDYGSTFAAISSTNAGETSAIKIELDETYFDHKLYGTKLIVYTNSSGTFTNSTALICLGKVEGNWTEISPTNNLYVTSGDGIHQYVSSLTIDGTNVIQVGSAGYTTVNTTYRWSASLNKYTNSATVYITNQWGGSNWTMFVVNAKYYSTNGPVGAFWTATNGTAQPAPISWWKTNATSVRTPFLFANIITNNYPTTVTFNSNITVAASIFPTNGLAMQGKISFTTNFTAVQSIQAYCCNGTNQLITLPNATNTTPFVIYRFSSTNANGSFTLTNANGFQTIRDGASLTYLNVGIGDVNLFHDGLNWWIGGKAKTVFPNASWSTSTNIALGTTNTLVTYDTLENNNGQGLALVDGSKLYITNAGQYMITYSVVITNASTGRQTCDIWLAKEGTNVARTRTRTATAAATATWTTTTMTVNYIVSVAAATYYELVGAVSDPTNVGLAATAAINVGMNAPAMPSIIVTVNKVSD